MNNQIFSYFLAEENQTVGRREQQVSAQEYDREVS